mgnify:CR=1 FL=1
MGIIDAFDSQSEEILKPSCIAAPVEGFPKTVIVTFQPDLTDILKSLFPVEIVSTMDSGVQVPVYRFWYKGRSLGLYLTTIGGPAAVGLMEEVLVKGAEKVLFFGACGVLDRTITAGRLILPTAAYRDEGTSYHYLPPSDYVEIPTAGRLGEIFQELQVPYVYGRTWTTDAIYRETRNNTEARRREGCVAVEMECASVMAAGQFRGVPVYQFLYAEDSLDGPAWEARSWHGVPRSAYEKYLQIALETAVRL